MHPDVADGGLFGEEIAFAHDEVGDLALLNSAVGVLKSQPYCRGGGERRQGVGRGEPPCHRDPQIG